MKRIPGAIVILDNVNVIGAALTGIYRCSVPNAEGSLQTLYVRLTGRLRQSSSKVHLSFPVFDSDRNQIINYTVTPTEQSTLTTDATLMSSSAITNEPCWFKITVMVVLLGGAVNRIVYIQPTV